MRKAIVVLILCAFLYTAESQYFKYDLFEIEITSVEEIIVSKNTHFYMQVTFIPKLSTQDYFYSANVGYTIIIPNTQEETINGGLYSEEPTGVYHHVLTMPDKYVEEKNGIGRNGIPESAKITGVLEGKVTIYEKNPWKEYRVYEINEKISLPVKFCGTPKSKLTIGNKIIQDDQRPMGPSSGDEESITYFQENSENIEVIIETTGYQVYAMTLLLNPVPPYDFSGDGWHSKKAIFTTP